MTTPVTEPNPYQAPQLSNDKTIEPAIAGTMARGWPEPIPLAIIGWVLAAGVVLLLIAATVSESPAAFFASLGVPLLRVLWMVVAFVKYRRYSLAWQKGERSFLLVTMVINGTLLLLDAAIVGLFAVCIAALSNANFGN